MKKSEAEGIGILIVLGIIVYPFIWLHEKIGWIGIGALALLIVGGWIYWHMLSAKKEEEEFNELVLYVLHNRIPLNEARKMNIQLAKSNFPRSALIRNLQILRDSVEIALSSKKRDTAESRMATVLERYDEIAQEQAGLVKPETMSEITRVIKETEKEFYTRLYQNVATAHLEKVEELKTQKSKSKYLQLAKEVLLEGLEDNRSRKDVLEQILARVDKAAASLADSS